MTRSPNLRRARARIAIWMLLATVFCGGVAEAAWARFG